MVEYPWTRPILSRECYSEIPDCAMHWEYSPTAGSDGIVLRDAKATGPQRKRDIRYIRSATFSHVFAN